MTQSPDNPWLSIPLADYEAHMRSAAVQQLDALADLFARAVDLRRPSSVAIIGIAGGNGLDRIDMDITRRIAGIDINPEYLDSVRARFPHLHGLELHCADLSEELLALQPAELVHAALVFEHAGTGRCLDNAIRLVAEDGALSVVLQLPGDPGQDVGQSGVASIQQLSSHFSLVDRERLSAEIAERGFHRIEESRVQLPMGKGFWMGVYARD